MKCLIGFPTIDKAYHWESMWLAFPTLLRVFSPSHVKTLP